MKMKRNFLKILLIAAVPKNERSGGISSRFFGVNSGLSKIVRTDVLYVVMPPRNFRERANGLLRKVGIKTSYEFFSNRRLDSVSTQVESYVNDQESRPDLLLFVGITHFVHCNPEIPYLIYQDCSFQSYFETYNRAVINHFRAESISSLVCREVVFAKKAKTLMFTSEWAKVEACKQGFSPKNLAVVPAAGEYSFNRTESVVNRFELLFVSTNFEGKGGFIVLEAFRILKKQFPEIQLTVVGQHPVINEAGVNGVGFLDKNIPSQERAISEIYSRCGLLLLPSKSDTTSILIKELRQYGCPVICSDWSALPEQIEEGVSGFVWPIESGVIGFVNRVSMVLKMSNEAYSDLRAGSLAASRNDATYDVIANKIMEYASS